MARNGAAVTTTAATPEEIYDQLSQDEQDIYDRIAFDGYTPEQAGRGWAATKGEDRIGPFPTLEELAEAVSGVQLASVNVEQESTSDEGQKDTTDADPSDTEEQPKQGKVIKLEADSNGNRFLPGTEPEIDQEVASAAGEYHALKTDRVNLLNKETQAKEKLIDICHRKKHLFKADPENTNAKIYKVSDLVIRIENEVKEKITTAIEKK